MKIACLTTISLAMLVLPACGSNSTTEQPDASKPSDGSTTSAPFELQGNWLYLGPWDGEHTLKIGNDSMEYASITGDWKSNWTIKTYDNGSDHFQIEFKSGNGSYYPTGKSLSATYSQGEMILTIQLADGLGSYPQLKNPESCTDEDTKPITDCRLYMKQN